LPSPLGMAAISWTDMACGCMFLGGKATVPPLGAAKPRAAKDRTEARVDEIFMMWIEKVQLETQKE